MSETKQHCCCGVYNNKSNKNNGYKRTIRNNAKIDNWNARNSSVQMNAVLSPDDYEQAKSECSCDLFEALPDEVTKTTGKIKWASGNKKPPTNSRYHAKCFSKKQPKPKFKKPSNIKRNIVPSANCFQCSAEPSKRKFKNECYCSYPPEKPFLPVKPAVTQPNPRRTIRSGFKSPDGELESSHTLQTLRKAKKLLQDYSPESEFLKRLQREAKDVYDCQCNACKTKEKTAGLQFTRHRQLLEEAYEDVEKNKQFTLDEIARECHKCELNSCKCNCGKCMVVSPRNSPRYSTLFSQNYGKFALSPKNSPNASPYFSPAGSNLLDCDKIHEIKHIRDDNYFETHSTNVNLAQKNIPDDHKCVHKFTLDKRLLPTPINADAFGVSRCIVCNKAMDSSKIYDEEYIYIADNDKSSKTTLQQKEEKFHQIMQKSPRKINFAGKKDVIELKVPPILIADRKDFKTNKIAPTNTWALRYQKGVV